MPRFTPPEEAETPFKFGLCYECRDGDHARCVGVPCQCGCSLPSPPELIVRHEEQFSTSMRRVDVMLDDETDSLPGLGRGLRALADALDKEDDHQAVIAFNVRASDTGWVLRVILEQA